MQNIICSDIDLHHHEQHRLSCITTNVREDPAQRVSPQVTVILHCHVLALHCGIGILVWYDDAPSTTQSGTTLRHRRLGLAPRCSISDSVWDHAAPSANRSDTSLLHWRLSLTPHCSIGESVWHHAADRRLGLVPHGYIHISFWHQAAKLKYQRQQSTFACDDMSMQSHRQ